MKKNKIRTSLLLPLAYAFCANVLCANAFATPGEDEVSIRKLQTAQAEAWNQHDAAAYTQLFAEDGDLVNVMGLWWKGHAQIESKLNTAFSGVFRDSQLTITDTLVRFVAPTIAVAHVRWTLVGAKMPSGVPEPREGIEIQVLQKTDGRWLIQSFQNTNGLPERPLPGVAAGALTKP